AGEEAHEGPALPRDLVANRPAEHRMARLQRIQDRALRGRALDVELQLSLHVGQRAQMMRKDDADDHGSVWTSTATTAGRCCTIGVQLPPASGDMYTCPPLVPK